MFTFGIFTTHFPYVIMVAFYAYFLLFGVSRANEGKIELTEKSRQVQIHIDNSIETIDNDTFCYYTSVDQIFEASVFEKNTEKQRWKHYCESQPSSQDFCGYSLFGRPPPVLA